MNTVINFGNLILSLSDALDLVNSAVAYHQHRTAYISLKLSEALDLTEETRRNIFIAALLHDIGVINYNEKLALQYFEVTNVNVHCIKGHLLLQRHNLFHEASLIIKHHHKPWHEWNEDIKNMTAVSSQIISLSDHIERLINRNKEILQQKEYIYDTISTYSGNLFIPKLIDLFKKISRNDSFWFDIISPKLYSRLLAYGILDKITINKLALESISKLFSDIIDFKSSYTASHSAGVSACAGILARLMGFDEEEIYKTQVAGHLHDLGKLSIPEDLLEKQSPLTDNEFNLIKIHPYQTCNILNSIKGMEEIARMASYHHEKIDGSGYPFQLSDNDLNPHARIIMISDIFSAIAQDRPYRSAMNKDDITEILKEHGRKNLLDNDIVKIFLKNFEKIYEQVRGMEYLISEFYRSRIENFN